MKQDLISFFENSKTPFHCVDYTKRLLIESGYEELLESKPWEHIPNKFFVIREGASLIAGNISNLDFGVICNAHCDFPALRARFSSNFSCENIQGVELYQHGGGMWYSWVDRDLKIAGRVFVHKNGGIEVKLVESKEAVAFIPTVSSRLNPSFSLKPVFDFDNHIIAITGMKNETETTTIFMRILAELCECEPSDIINFDINFVDAQPPAPLGFDEDILCAQGIDDLSCAYSTVRAFLEAKDPIKGSYFMGLFDNEEIGSNNLTGGKSNFMQSVFARLKCSKEFLRNSYMISADVAHGISPNYYDVKEELNSAHLGDGVFFTWNQNMLMATESSSLTFPRILAQEFGIKFSSFCISNSQRSGSTIGPQMSTNLGMKTIDMGVPVASMHSIRETASFFDVFELTRLIRVIFENYLRFIK